MHTYEESPYVHIADKLRMLFLWRQTPDFVLLTFTIYIKSEVKSNLDLPQIALRIPHQRNLYLPAYSYH